MTDQNTLSLEQLAIAADLPLRTVRFYIQKGLVPRPTGSTRAATYGPVHLQALLRLRQWSAAGLSLSRIAELLSEPVDLPPMPRRQPGALEVRTHVHLGEGLELVVTPDRAGLDADQLRALIRAVLEAHAALRTTVADAVSVKGPTP